MRPIASVVMLLVVACGAPAPAPSPTSEPFVPPPLPAGVALPKGDVGITPASAPGAVPGVPQPFSLGHCGIASPIDWDGSLWLPVGASDLSGGPLDERQESELINASEGFIELVAPLQARYRSRSGLLLFLERLPGAHGYPLCD